MVTVQDKLKFT